MSIFVKPIRFNFRFNRFLNPRHHPNGSVGPSRVGVLLLPTSFLECGWTEIRKESGVLPKNRQIRGPEEHNILAEAGIRSALGIGVPQEVLARRGAAMAQRSRSGAGMTMARRSVAAVALLLGAFQMHSCKGVTHVGASWVSWEQGRDQGICRVVMDPVSRESFD